MATNRVRSAKGEVIDFDLIKIKQQIAEADISVDVKKRKRYIDKKEGIKAAEAEVESEEILEETEVAEDGVDEVQEPEVEEVPKKKTRRSKKS